MFNQPKVIYHLFLNLTRCYFYLSGLSSCFAIFLSKSEEVVFDLTCPCSTWISSSEKNLLHKDLLSLREFLGRWLGYRNVSLSLCMLFLSMYTASFNDWTLPCCHLHYCENHVYPQTSMDRILTDAYRLSVSVTWASYLHIKCSVVSVKFNLYLPVPFASRVLNPSRGVSCPSPLSYLNIAFRWMLRAYTFVSLTFKVVWTNDFSYIYFKAWTTADRKFPAMQLYLPLKFISLTKNWYLRSIYLSSLI